MIERSRLDTLYFDASGHLLLSIKGTRAMTEADRDALFTVDDSNRQKPRGLWWAWCRWWKSRRMSG